MNNNYMSVNWILILRSSADVKGDRLHAESVITAQFLEQTRRHMELKVDRFMFIVFIPIVRKPADKR